MGSVFEEPHKKPAPRVCVTESDSECLLVKSESDLGPEDLAATSKDDCCRAKLQFKVTRR